MLFNLKLKYGLKNLTKVGEKVLKKRRRIKMASILHVTFAKEKVIWRRIAGLKENHSAETAKNSDMWKNLAI